ncbi:NAD(P)H-dependent oxidoreductase [Sulfitobacter sp. M57]|uniref:NAD(P)H-dependent oxidoreductase n=1 Tax=unclassified Sulfitobacter TaxID=196795 RepID=UPI0023E13BEA|nr:MULTISPECIES: NAD(P)H-dependent oxidoreductase [unclassified Sulfitobacter]MDF3414787.1 NAD(P)H-dependent oxidoreductase [Sulfitobacter sp. KE5]MDF3422268.1 NAD(P)H-dependent oxidoreductase [Sulfitobacter sp. KE43]MDF3433333.1 NAD(P)H-dependent oxidoreductase [Sulfitobacter sp. KE42]MDF3458973.1 NAD(P)H-dependent oxidoreductase [Sulfitobacter sp. S74]MDF3462872.1 NAD(P)H-dependent oxidoreductase [Sulfitobacter sp. Ks18]
MHVLTILDHPNPASFSAAIAQRFIAGAEAAGHSTELADLNAEGFDPRWRMADIEGDDSGAVPPDVLREQTRIARADAVCFVFPLFWWGMPAMTKGWVDRVWSWGWAYDQLDDPEVSLQRPRTGLLLVPAGARSDEMEDKGYLAALETAWMAGTFGYFGFVRRDLKVLNGSKGSAARRDRLLDTAYQSGFTLAGPV